MEFLTGYAAAKAPYLTYEVEGAHHSHRNKKPGRSNSTSGTAATKKRSRIPGHARTNSASTNSSSGGRTEHQAAAAAPPPQTSQHHHQSPDGAGADRSGTGARTEQQQPQQQQQQQQHNYHGHPSRRDSTRERERERERDPRMPASSLKYYQDKQLPATPRLNTQDASHRNTGAANSPDPHSARTPASAGALTASFGNPGTAAAAVTFPDRRTIQQSGMFAYADGLKLPRAESVSSVSGATTTSNRTMHSTEQTSSDSSHQHRPFIARNGRTYLADATLPYPLPIDLEELHRQSLKTMLLMQLFGRPICSPAFANKPPPRILEIGCGTGFWSMMCYRYYEARGQHADMSFTGLDIVPLPPNAGPSSNSNSNSSSSGAASSTTSSSAPPTAAATDASAAAAVARPDQDMNWRFVQHDLRKLPLPFPDESFDFVMAKDMALATSMTMQQGLIEEYIRVLRPGGTLEIWETDHLLRMLRPHVPESATTSGPTPAPPPAPPTDAADQLTETSTDDDDDSDSPQLGGAYVMTGNTPLSTPLNNFLVEYNSWVSRALEARALCAMPCTVIGPLLIQEAEVLTGVGSRRLAVPLSEIRWEREGVGGVVTKDGKSYVDMSAGLGKGRAVAGGGGGRRDDGGGGGGTKGLEPAAAALRRIALMTVVQQIQSLEPVLREVCGKSQDEWDTWLGKMMNDLVRENGTSWGECLEVGAWWARKR